MLEVSSEMLEKGICFTGNCIQGLFLLRRLQAAAAAQYDMII